MTEYHDGVPVLPPADAERAADKLRIQVIGIRAGWSAWAARESAVAAMGPLGDGASDARWRELMTVDTALRAAETQLEAAIEKIANYADRAAAGWDDETHQGNL